MNGADINAQGLQFNVQTAGELAHKGLSSTVHARKRSWNKAGNTGSEDDAALLLFTDPFGGKVVGNVDNRSSIACLEKIEGRKNSLSKHDKCNTFAFREKNAASNLHTFHVDQKLSERCLVEKSSDEESGIVEDDLNINVLGGLLDLLEVIDSGSKVDANGTEFEIWESLLELFHGALEKVIVERDDDHVEALLGQLEGKGLSNSGSSSGDKSPGGIVALLKVGDGTECHVQLRQGVHDNPKGGRDGEDGQDHELPEWSGMLACKLFGVEKSSGVSANASI